MADRSIYHDIIESYIFMPPLSRL